MTDIEPYRYGYAIDEINGLRAGTAYEATVLDGVLDDALLPAKAREALEGMRARLREAARGGWDDAWYHTPADQKRNALKEAGAAEILTRGTWEAERV